MTNPKLRDCVRFHALDNNGAPVLQEILGTYEWYEHLHPVIDSDAERSRLKIGRICGEQYDVQGNLVMRWSNSYLADGRIFDEEITGQDGTTERRTFAAQ